MCIRDSYKTTDSGATWILLPGTAGIAVWSLALWPGNDSVIAAGSGTGVFLSRDAGASWKRISPEGDSELRPVVSLAFHPADSRILYEMCIRDRCEEQARSTNTFCDEPRSA